MSNADEQAFPRVTTHQNRGAHASDYFRVYSEGGLTKRELLAAMATQPGVTEIVTAAGLHCPDNVSVWKDAETRIGFFTDWWAKLSNEERFRLAAKVRIQQADALLAMLEATPVG